MSALFDEIPVEDADPADFVVVLANAELEHFGRFVVGEIMIKVCVALPGAEARIAAFPVGGAVNVTENTCVHADGDAVGRLVTVVEQLSAGDFGGGKAGSREEGAGEYYGEEFSDHDDTSLVDKNNETIAIISIS